MFMVLSSWPSPLQKFARFIWWIQTERLMAGKPQTKPTDLSGESADKWLLLFTSTCHLLLLLSPTANTYLPSHGGWKAESTGHCRKGAQSVPKAVVINNCPRPVTLQPLDHCDLQKQIVMNNLPKVMTWQCGGRESNSQPLSC